MRGEKLKNEENLNWFTGGFLIGAGIGALSGLTASLFYRKNKTMDADSVLSQVKEAFLKEGPIEGSWIHFEKEPLQKFAIKSKTYTGGITRLEDNTHVQYEFIADAYTGTVLDIYRL